MKKIIAMFAFIALNLLNATDLLPLPKDFQRNPELYINKIDIDAELCGPLMKSIIEIEFYNPYDRDSLETKLEFSTSAHSFVKELWLDINGEYKISENFSARTGTNIYNRITKIQKKDPALLTVGWNGNFNLSVYPFMKGQSRKVKIEMYSTLEQKNDTLKWDFIPIMQDYNEKSYDINLKLKPKLPDDSYAISDNKMIKLGDKAVELKYNGRMSLRLLIPILKEKYLIFSKDLKYLWDLNNVKNQLPKDVIFLPKELEGIELLKYLLDNVKNENKSVFPTCNLNNSYDGFINFLKTKKGAKITTWFKDNMTWWDFKGQIKLIRTVSKIKLNSTDLILFPFEQDSIYTKEISCDYLNCFIDFTKLSNGKNEEKIKSGFLTTASSKLVLEDNERVTRIRDEEVKREEERLNRNKQLPPPPPPKVNTENESTKQGVKADKKTINEPTPPPPPPKTTNEEEVFDFFAIQEKPQLNPGLGLLMQNYIQKNYPQVAMKQKISGKVILKFTCTKDGIADNITITMEKPANMGFGEVAINALKLYGKFNPAMERNKPVACRMSQKFDFKAGPSKGNKDNIDYYDFSKLKDNEVYVNNKKYIINLPDSLYLPMMVESGYKGEDYIKVKYKSDDYYEMIFNDPELFDLIWTQYDILFTYRGKWYRIVQ
jgi:hypothetical protein